MLTERIFVVHLFSSPNNRVTDQKRFTRDFCQEIIPISSEYEIDSRRGCGWLHKFENFGSTLLISWSIFSNFWIIELILENLWSILTNLDKCGQYSQFMDVWNPFLHFVISFQKFERYLVSSFANFAVSLLWNSLIFETYCASFPYFLSKN